MSISIQYLVLIVSGALLGWAISRLFIGLLFKPQTPVTVAGIHFSGILPSLKPVLLDQAEKLAGQFNLQEKISGSIDLNQLLPEIEGYVDSFLKLKLKEAFPLLSNFMGEKTLSKFKDAFMQEVTTRLPELLNNYAARLSATFDVKQMIKEKVEAIDFTRLEKTIREKAKKQLLLLQFAGIVLGVLTALLQIFLLNVL
ncbi:MAG TPA: hypothetical protein PK504_02255 [Ferruginibacter sp.]|nr:hypothetical protein [Ferruginibacter sp.]HRE63374.1 hypothetical protein [Ferruginibacter sp.]